MGNEGQVGDEGWVGNEGRVGEGSISGGQMGDKGHRARVHGQGACGAWQWVLMDMLRVGFLSAGGND